MDIRARSISFTSRPRRPYGPPDHACRGEARPGKQRPFSWLTNGCAWMRCRLSPTADVPSHTSGAAVGPGCVKTPEPRNSKEENSSVRSQARAGMRLEQPASDELATNEHAVNESSEFSHSLGQNPLRAPATNPRSQLRKSDAGLSCPTGGAWFSDPVRCTHRQVVQLVRELPLKRERAEFLVPTMGSTGAAGRHNRKQNASISSAN
jgi:hypothetical protein